MKNLTKISHKNDEEKGKEEHVKIELYNELFQHELSILQQRQKIPSDFNKVIKLISI